MKKTRVSLMERKRIGLNQNQSSTQRKQTTTYPRVTRKNISVNMVNTRSNKGQKNEEKFREEPIVPVKETDLETPDQSIHGAERKKTEWTLMPIVEEQGTKTIELSPTGNGDEITNNTPEMIKDYSQTKITSFTERFAARVGMKPREKEEEVTAATEKKLLVRFPQQQRKLNRKRSKSHKEQRETRINER